MSAQLTKEQAADRRRGIAAATALLAQVEAHGRDISPDISDAAYDSAHEKWLSVVLEHLRAFAAQTRAAQQGFAFVLADHFWSWEINGCMLAAEAYDSAEFHGTEVLTPSEMIDVREAKRSHDGKAVTPTERVELGCTWVEGRTASELHDA